MNKENENTKIADLDLKFIAGELKKSDKPAQIADLTKALAYHKIASQLNQDVRIYDQAYQYNIGDLVLKSYDEPLMVSSKGTEHYTGEVVLKVINKIQYDNFDCDMIEVDYTGGGLFRRHIDYMKKTKTQVLLPCNLNKQEKEPETLSKDQDPRLKQLPMTEKDLRTLEKNLQSAMGRMDQFFTWNHNWQLSSNLKDVKEGVIKKIQAQIKKEQKSILTSDIAQTFLGCSPEDVNFDITCLSLNFILDKRHKKTFVFVDPDNWGKWHLREILDGKMKEIPLSSKRAKLPQFEGEKCSSSEPVRKFPLKLYLSWREVLSGGIKVPRSVNKDLHHAREYLFRNAETRKTYTVFYYPSSNIFLGLEQFFEENTVPQGASLTLRKAGPTEIMFSLKKSKKSLGFPLVSYDTKKDQFNVSDEEGQTKCLPNKIIFLEKHILANLFSFYKERAKLDLRELMVLIFKNFGMEGDYPFLHYLRAFHLVDLLRQTYEEDVETTLLNSPEFSKSEKKKGIFYYMEKVKTEEEIQVDVDEEEKPMTTHLEKPASQRNNGLTIGMIADEAPKMEAGEPEQELKIVEIIEEPPPPKPKAPPVKPSPKPVPSPKFKIQPAPGPQEGEPVKKSKETKKKLPKVKIELEKGPRRRKGARKIREEELELEESELEALFAVKAEDEEREPVIEKTVKAEKTEEAEKVDVAAYKSKKPEEEKFGGMFGAMLKTALDVKKDEAKDTKGKGGRKKEKSHK